MSQRDILIFFGAGASKAANSQFPLVGEFFRIAGKMVQGDIKVAEASRSFPSEWDPFWDFLHVVETNKLWDGNVLPTHSHVIEFIQKCEGNDLLKVVDSMREYLSWMLSLNPGNSGTNIENVVTAIEQFSFKDGANQAKKSLTKFLVWLFSRVEREAALDYKNTPHARLVKTLADKGLLKRTILVSFNYDLVLERSIRALDSDRDWLWHGITGYGFGCPGYFSMNEMKLHKKPVPKQNDDRLVLLKPHGSLAWFRDHDEVYPIVDDRDAYSGRPTAPMDDKQLQSAFASNPYEPVIIPPGKIKRMAGLHSWETWKLLQNALELGVKKVAVVGWNVPETDGDVRNRINRFIDRRSDENIIKKLVVCDVKKEDSFGDRMSMIFMPAQLKTLTDGFQEGAEEIVLQLIK
jgi:hypothetical protein